MIYVRVEMWPKGASERRYLLGEALVSNVGGTESVADYKAVLSKKGGFKSGEDSMACMDVKNVWKNAAVSGFQRSRRGFWQLLSEVLSSVCGEKP